MMAQRKAAKKLRREKWKCSRGRPLRIGGTIIRTSNSTTLTIETPLKIKRIRACDIDAPESEKVV